MYLEHQHHECERKKKSQKSSPVHMNHCIIFFLKKRNPPPNEEEKELKHPSFVLLVSFAVVSTMNQRSRIGGIRSKPTYSKTFRGFE